MVCACARGARADLAGLPAILCLPLARARPAPPGAAPFILLDYSFFSLLGRRALFNFCFLVVCFAHF